jgi:hypothetical protein
MPDKEKDAEEKSGEFKVTDRRLFTSEGERRVEVKAEPPLPESPAANQPPAGPLHSEPRPETPHAEMPSQRHGPPSFEHLVMSLATTAMFQLGLVKGSEEETPRVDLLAAKETIDLLDILQQKTKGNLSGTEEDLLRDSLYELRMVFVELSGTTGRGR